MRALFGLRPQCVERAFCPMARSAAPRASRAARACTSATRASPGSRWSMSNSRAAASWPHPDVARSARGRSRRGCWPHGGQPGSTGQVRPAGCDFSPVAEDLPEPLGGGRLRAVCQPSAGRLPVCRPAPGEPLVARRRGQRSPRDQRGCRGTRDRPRGLTPLRSASAPLRCIGPLTRPLAPLRDLATHPIVPLLQPPVGGGRVGRSSKALGAVGGWSSRAEERSGGARIETTPPRNTIPPGADNPRSIPRITLETLTIQPCSPFPTTSNTCMIDACPSCSRHSPAR